MRADLKRRLGVAVVGIPVGFGVVWSGGWVLALVLLALGVIGSHEMIRLAEARGIRPFAWIALPVAAALLGSAQALGDPAVWGGWAFGLTLASALLALLAAVFFRGSAGQPLEAVAVTVLAPLYTAAPLAFGLFLRDHPASASVTFGWAGTFLLLFPLIVTWFGDSGAYFGGHAMGRRKLMPSVSPAKTVEGSAWGLVASVLGAVFLSTVVLPLLGGGELLSWRAAAILGLILGAVAQTGDLAESALKRSSGVKDSGVIIPGHGGVLDRFDAVFLTLPVFWLLLPFFLGWGTR
jgi:phosphatidate cytidylyltransferase